MRLGIWGVLGLLKKLEGSFKASGLGFKVLWPKNLNKNCHVSCLLCFGIWALGGCLGCYMAGCQNYDPFFGTLNIRCRIIIGTQKGTIF